jgi:hypothetical protein
MVTMILVVLAVLLVAYGIGALRVEMTYRKTGANPDGWQMWPIWPTHFVRNELSKTDPGTGALVHANIASNEDERTGAVQLFLAGFVVVTLLCLALTGVVMVFNRPVVAASAPPATPTAVPPAMEPTVAVVEQSATAVPAVVEVQEVTAVPQPTAEGITSIKQLSAGEDVLPDWDNPNAAVLTGVNLVAQARTLMGGEGVPLDSVNYIQYLHGDPTMVTFKDRAGEILFQRDFKEGWLVTFEMCPGCSFEIGTEVGFNSNTGHYNVSPEAYAVPAGVDATTAGLYLQWLFQGTTGDLELDASAQAYAIAHFDVGNTTDWRGKDPTVNAVHVTSEGQVIEIAPSP